MPDQNQNRKQNKWQRSLWVDGYDVSKPLDLDAWFFSAALAGSFDGTEEDPINGDLAGLAAREALC